MYGMQVIGMLMAEILVINGVEVTYIGIYTQTLQTQYMRSIVATIII